MNPSIEYVAGLFDGEGCVNIYSTSPKRGQRRTRLRASIGNTNLRVLLMIQESFGGRLRVLKGHHRPVYVLTWDGNAADEFLQTISPHLIVKSDQADLAKEYWEYMHSDGRCVARTDKRGRIQKAKSQECLDSEILFKNRMHDLKGNASTRGRITPQRLQRQAR